MGIKFKTDDSLGPIVILPFPFVTDIPEPALKVVLDNPPVLVLPINNWPLV